MLFLLASVDLCTVHRAEARHDRRLVFATAGSSVFIRVHLWLSSFLELSSPAS